MISLTPIIELLKPKPLDFEGFWFRDVQGVGAYVQVDANSVPTPTAWVVRSAEKSSHAGERAEIVTVSFDVIIAIDNARVHGIGDSDEQLLAYRLAIKTLLLGEQLGGALVEGVVYNGGRVLRYEKEDLVWADNYSFDALVTNYLPDPPAFESAVYTGERE